EIELGKPADAIGIRERQDADDSALGERDGHGLGCEQRGAHPCAYLAVTVWRERVGQEGLARCEEDFGDALGVRGARRAQLSGDETRIRSRRTGRRSATNASRGRGTRSHWRG